MSKLMQLYMSTCVDVFYCVFLLPFFHILPLIRTFSVQELTATFAAQSTATELGTDAAVFAPPGE